MRKTVLMMLLCGSVLGFEGPYAGIGVGYSNLNNTYRDTDPDEIQFKDQKVSRIFGAGILGSGANIFGIYTGIEAFVDIGENKHQEIIYEDGNARGVYSKNAGDYFGLRMRLGKEFGNNLIYISGGASYAKHDILYCDYRFKTRKFLPVIGIGYEKKLNDHFSLRADLSKKLSMKKHYDVLESKTNFGPSLTTIIVYNFR